MTDTDTEDPNIATLRTFLGYHLRGHQSAALSDARQAISALASTLAERDRRIAEQQSLLRRFLALTFEGGAPENLIEAARTVLALEAPPAPAPGELAKALEDADRYVRETNAGYVEEISAEAVAQLALAARSWQRLQWRPASEAPCGMLLTTYETDGERIFVIDEKHAEDDGWDERDDMALPIDALPALNGGDDNG